MSTLTFAVCAYKESPYLRECVQSLLSQTVPCPVILSTSTPNDLIRKTAEEFSLSLFVHDHMPNIADDWNSAYRETDSDYVVIAHQDDIYEPDYAKTALAMLDNTEKPLIFFSDYYEIRDGRKTADTKNLRIKRRLLKPLTDPKAASSRSAKRRVLSLGNPICCPSVAYVKAGLPEAPFRSGLGSNLDWEAWERFSRLDGAFVYDTHRLVGHRVHEASATSALISENRRTKEDLEMLKKFWPAPAAALINRFYRNAEASNTLEK